MLLAASVLLPDCGPRNSPTGAIEKEYYAAGPWQVTVNLGGACCDSLHNRFDLYYPTNLGAGVAINALVKSSGSIKTVIPIELPAHMWCTLGGNCPDTHNVTSGSIFLI
jgi:hypothetical protein